VHFPLDYIGASLLSLATLFGIFMTVVWYRQKGKISWVCVLLSLSVLLFALNTFAYRGTITLSSASQTFTLDERSFYYRHTHTYPLNSLEEAVVKAGRNQNKELTLLLSSGEEVSVGNGYSGREGMFQAAHAINAFLARNAQK
jgi:uncharacterized protein (UPF0333 family)